MVVRNLNVVGVSLSPLKTNPPLIVDPNAVLPFAVPTQPFQTVAGERRENSQFAGRIEHIELPKCRALDGAKLPAGQAMKESLSLVGPEGLDHRPSL